MNDKMFPDVPAEFTDEVHAVMARFWRTNSLNQIMVIIQEALAEARKPKRGDAVEAWLKKCRDEFGNYSDSERYVYYAIDNLLNNYRLHADTGTPLDSQEPMQ